MSQIKICEYRKAETCGRQKALFCRGLQERSDCNGSKSQPVRLNGHRHRQSAGVYRTRRPARSECGSDIDTAGRHKHFFPSGRGRKCRPVFCAVSAEIIVAGRKQHHFTLFDVQHLSGSAGICPRGNDWCASVRHRRKPDAVPAAAERGSRRRCTGPHRFHYERGFQRAGSQAVYRRPKLCRCPCSSVPKPSPRTYPTGHPGKNYSAFGCAVRQCSKCDGKLPRLH